MVKGWIRRKMKRFKPAKRVPGAIFPADTARLANSDPASPAAKALTDIAQKNQDLVGGQQCSDLHLELNEATTGSFFPNLLKL